MPRSPKTGRKHEFQRHECRAVSSAFAPFFVFGKVDKNRIIQSVLKRQAKSSGQKRCIKRSYVNWTREYYAEVDNNYFRGHDEPYFDTYSVNFRGTNGILNIYPPLFWRADQKRKRFLWIIPAFCLRFNRRTRCKANRPYKVQNVSNSEQYTA